MKLFIKILLFVLVALVANVKVTSATITFSNIQEVTTSFLFHSETPKTICKVIKDNETNCCQNRNDLVDCRNLVLASKANAAKGGSNLWRVGRYNTLQGAERGLRAHHVGQKALMEKFVQGYNWRTAPSILVPEIGHNTRSALGIVSRNMKGFTNAREVLARDIFELRRVYNDVPNRSLQELIQMNKTMFPNAFVK